ncbi:hypothetical protein [Glutamicibacter arilaitensis]|uniref:hypothetical protein n=1 Tax=Glutamicibacter arilaitensis TaxID=256701 RepID=UPI003850ED03
MSEGINDPDRSELVILDAGPVLNFLARKETADLYLETLQGMADKICVPDAVVDEIENKSKKDKRFSACRTKLQTILIGNHMVSLQSPPLHQDADFDFHWSWVRNNCSKASLASGKDRGEMVLVAHARVLQAQGLDVVAMIDDQGAVNLAHKAGIPTFSTVDLFVQSIILGVIVDRPQLKRLYGLVEEMDDGLLPFKQTLLNREFRK